MQLNNYFLKFINNFLLGRVRLIYIIIFFFISFSFWTLTKLSNEYSTIISFELEFDKLPSYLLINDISYNKIDVSLKTSGFQLLFNQFFNKKIKIKLSENYIKDNEIKIKSQSFLYIIKDRLDSNTEIIGVFPEEIKIKYIKKHRKRVHLKPPTFNLKSGYGISKIKFISDSVWINGSKEIIDKINFLQIMSPDLNSIDKDFSYNFEIIDNGKFTIEKLNIYGDVYVERFSEKTFSIPLVIKNLPDSSSIKLFPSHIDITFSASLSRIKMIESKDFLFTTSFLFIKDSLKMFLPVKLELFPDQIYNIKWNPKKVEFLIKNNF
tara:strand:- start:94 stop:1059 length:966 start_codon:yes stop_codon:yes gene_type:complete